MILKKTAIVIILLYSVFFSLFPAHKISAQDSNAGFVPENIWFSKDPFEEGDKVKIYTVIFNPDIRELSGSVVFFDNNVFLGKKDFVAPAKSVKDISLDWTATIGNHNIFGKIENAKFLVSPGKYEEVYLAENETSKSSRTVNKKIVPKTADAETNTDPNPILNAVNSIISEPVKNIGKMIENNTPDVIAKPIISVGSAIDKVRSDAGTALQTQKDEVKNQIEILNSKGAQSGSEENTSKAETDSYLKPFKYTELFALALFSGVFNNKLIFYAILALAVFFLLRYIVKRVR